MKSDDAKDFAERLRVALQDAGVRPSPTVVAHAFNQRYWGKSITVHTARTWLVGASIPMQDKLVVLAKWLKVSPQELRFGYEKPEISAQNVREGDPIVDQLNLQDREFLRNFMQLSPSDKRLVRDVVDALSIAAATRKKNAANAKASKESAA
jgi:hypothetical protein